MASPCANATFPGCETTKSLAARAMPMASPCANATFPWCDTTKSFLARAMLLAAALTPAEQITQLSTFSFTSNHSGMNPGVPRLRLPEYNYHTEGLHGVRDSCDSPSTLWPQVSAMAATGNISLIHEMGAFMGAGFRAANNMNRGKPLPDKGCGLSVYGPTMNINRDPRWGRNQETVSEDPFLNGAYAAALVRGVQGDDPRYLQVAFTCKHFTAYSVETDRMHGSDAVVSDRDLSETFLPAFKACVIAGSAQLMCAYNAITSPGRNATGACYRGDLINGLLREEWGWGGSMVSDCDAVQVQAWRHTTNERAAAAAIEAGCDQDCGGFYGAWGLQALEQGLVTKEQLTTALARVLLMRFRLGEFDPPSDVTYTKIGRGTSNSSASAASALRAARESIVLLNNSASALPLCLKSSGSVERTSAAAGGGGCDGAGRKLKVALLGPFAELTSELMGQKSDYTPYRIVSFADGLRARADSLQLSVATGCADVACAFDARNFSRAAQAAAAADVTVVALGIDRTVEGEGKDRTNVTLPGHQLELLQRAAVAAGDASKVVVVLANGGPLAVDWVKHHMPTVVEAFLGGQSAGTALAEVLLGDVSPSGVLPFTMYPQAFIEQNAMTDFRMRPAAGTTGRTYRFYAGTPLWPFGFGLSYTTFAFAWSSNAAEGRDDAAAVVHATTASLLPTAATPGVSLSLRLTNSGGVGAAKVILFFVARIDGGGDVERGDGGHGGGDDGNDDGGDNAAPPRKTLVSIDKVFLPAHASTTVGVTSGAGAELGYCAFCTVAADGKTRRIEAGTYEVSVGDGASSALTPQRVVVTGKAVVLPL